MHRLSAFGTVLVLALAGPVSAQEILVSKPPVYKHGESYVGVVEDHSGILYRYEQKAYKYRKGKVMLVARMSDPGGVVASRAAVDPETFALFSKGDGDYVNTTATNCSMAALYPIVEDKRYTCAYEQEVNGRKVAGTQSIRILKPVRNRAGKVTEVCMDTIADDSETLMKTRDCWTPDGKWMHSSKTLVYEQKQKA